MDLTCHWDRNPARLQVPSTKTTSGLAVEVEGKGSGYQQEQK